MIGTVVAQFVFFTVYIATLVFLPAGTLAYPAGWAFLVLMLQSGILITVWLERHDPSLLRERMSSPIQRAQEPWDRVFLGVLMVVFTAWVAFSSWDAARRGFAAVPAWLQVLGGAGVVIYALVAWLAFRENRFAAPVVKLQAGQHVIDTGPYAIVRHPMYAGGLFLFAGVPLLLGSWWGLVGSAILIGMVAWRAVHEERTLREELSGYDAYTRRVRYRFVPGIW